MSIIAYQKHSAPILIESMAIVLILTLAFRYLQLQGRNRILSLFRQI